MGDLNLGLKLAEPLLAEAGFCVAGDALTFPVHEARVKLDYVAVDDMRVGEEAAIVTPISDHCALVAVMTTD